MTEETRAYALFLETNVLFSGAYSPDAGLRRLWKRPGAGPITSVYAAEEARKNLSNPGQREVLEELLSSVEVVPPVRLSSIAHLENSVALQRPAHTASSDRCRNNTPSYRRLPALRPVLQEENTGGTHPAARRLALSEYRIVCSVQ